MADPYVGVEAAIGDLPDPDGDHDVANHVATNHTKSVRERFAAMDQGKGMESVPEEMRTQKQSQQRLDAATPAPTMVTLPDDFVHPTQPRIPTVREMARIQTFPDWFVFSGPRRTGGSHRQKGNCQYQQVGNAVPVDLAAAVVGELL